MSGGSDRPAVLRGALAGALAAAVWAIQQPLDKRVFGSDYDDVELLGRAVTGSEAWRPIGLGIHLANGAAFGATYAVVGDRIPLPAPLRAPAMALAENFVSWPLGAVSDRVHPARKQLPTLWGNRAALAQATWRHLLFGLVLGELVRRTQPEPEPEPEPVPEATYSSNGHGSLTHALTGQPDQ